MIVSEFATIDGTPLTKEQVYHDGIVPDRETLRFIYPDAETMEARYLDCLDMLGFAWGSHDYRNYIDARVTLFI